MRPRRHRATCSPPRRAAEEPDHIASFVFRTGSISTADESCGRENGGDDRRRSGNEPDPREVDSTIKTPVCSATRNQQASPRRWRRAHDDAALHSCANVAPPIRDRAEPARKPPGIVGLASLNPARCSFDKLDRLGGGRAGIVERGGASLTSNPISQS
jgi:hypothetical protein